MKLVLQRKGQKDTTGVYTGGPVKDDKGEVKVGIALLTPAGLAEDQENYWAYRVDVGHGQAVVGFPKFMTIGVGFAVEKDDWNTNLPYVAGAERIWKHIRKNKGKGPTDEDCIKAIEMVCAAAAEDHGAADAEMVSRINGLLDR